MFSEAHFLQKLVIRQTMFWFRPVMFFKICLHIFIFFEDNWSDDFDHAESGAKMRVVLQLNIFSI